LPFRDHFSLPVTILIPLICSHIIPKHGKEIRTKDGIFLDTDGNSGYSLAAHAAEILPAIRFSLKKSVYIFYAIYGVFFLNE